MFVPVYLHGRKQQGFKALRAKRNLNSAPWFSVVLPATSVLKTLQTSHLNGRCDARPRVNRPDRTPPQFKRLSCLLSWQGPTRQSAAARRHDTWVTNGSQLLTGGIR